ncbi:hypothetical protein KM043_005948 [Ampulex compressa]|nr:hypothetical protein KM043_005948 [Ampulex compressa]
MRGKGIFFSQATSKSRSAGSQGGEGAESPSTGPRPRLLASDMYDVAPPIRFGFGGVDVSDREAHPCVIGRIPRAFLICMYTIHGAACTPSPVVPIAGSQSPRLFRIRPLSPSCSTLPPSLAQSSSSSSSSSSLWLGEEKRANLPRLPTGGLAAPL